MNTTPTNLAIIGRSASGQPRTYRLLNAHPRANNAAYRRLAAAILGLDVFTLAHELRSARLGILPNSTAA